MEFLNSLFSTNNFIPHGHCYLWKPGLVWLHLLSDVLTGLAYYSIPLMLVYFVRKRKDMPFGWIFLMFGTFIVACGTTHFVDVWTLWYPVYWLSGFTQGYHCFYLYSDGYTTCAINTPGISFTQSCPTRSGKLPTRSGKLPTSKRTLPNANARKLCYVKVKNVSSYS